MKKIFTLVSLLIYNIANAQVENALRFDNIDDKVEVANASALIANASSFSMSFWVNPQNAAPVFPDYDGICGFRNDLNCDFYVVQTTAQNIEARFRNSAGGFFDINSPTLQINTWQHYVMTYDGSYMRLYRNGWLLDSIAASGTITNTAGTLGIGNLIYASNNFFLDGSVDEVSLWNVALTLPEINCIYLSYVDTTSSGLLLYYKFDQGIPGMQNTGIDTLVPTVGNLYGALSNFNLSGQTSNWVSGKQNFTTTIDVICPGDVYTFGTQSITMPGIYTEAYTAINGCDSIARLTLYPTLTDSVVIYLDSLMAQQANAVYQWIDCNNANSPIPNETNRSYYPSVSGNFAVIVSYNNCTDTSDCVFMPPVGIDNILNSQLNIYPNPVQDKIIFSQSLNEANISITDVTGKEVYAQKNFEGKFIDVSFLSKGNYLIKIVIDANVKTIKLIKE